MVQGPAGGPRPAASCNLSVKATFNAEQVSSSEKERTEAIITSRSIVSRASDVSITEEVKEIGGKTFNTVVVDIVIGDSVLLDGVEAMVSDLEDVLGERVSVEIEAL